MKKTLAMLLCLLLLPMSWASADIITTFTHPEIGEIIEFGLDNQMPYFKIYGFTQYKIVDPGTPYRGLSGYGNLKGKGITPEAMMDKLFASLRGESTEEVPVLFEYKGVLEDWAYLLEPLNEKARASAISQLAGFAGTAGYEALRKVEGFADFDAEAAAENYQEYSITLDGKEMPYRVLMFYFEEESWEEAYFERYAFVQQGKQWRLHQITKEYYSDYRDRIEYIHGLAGTSDATLQKGYDEIFQGLSWFSTPEVLKGATQQGDGSYVIEQASLYRLAASVRFEFKDGTLSQIRYNFTDEKAYYPAFVSLYTRFYDPISVDGQGNASWSLPSMQLELVHEAGAPHLIITPRVDPNVKSLG